MKTPLITGARLLLALDYLEFLSHCCSDADRQGDPRTVRNVKPQYNPRGFSTNPRHIVAMLARGFGLVPSRKIWDGGHNHVIAFSHSDFPERIAENHVLVSISLYYRHNHTRTWPLFQSFLRDNIAALGQVELNVERLIRETRTKYDLRVIDQEGLAGEYAFERFLRLMALGEIMEADLRDPSGT